MKKEHKEYLDQLQESGEVNMIGARPYIMEEFDVTKPEATAILAEWIASFK
jgi:uncharacterized protein YciI